MKRLVVVSVTSCALTGMIALCLGIVYGQAVEKEKGITLTEKQWQALLDKRIAQELEKAGLNSPVSDERVRNPDNWHRARYRDWEYTIYTGPGQIMPTRWVPPNEGGPQKAGPASGPAQNSGTQAPATGRGGATAPPVGGR